MIRFGAAHTHLGLCPGHARLADRKTRYRTQQLCDVARFPALNLLAVDDADGGSDLADR